MNNPSLPSIVPEHAGLTAQNPWPGLAAFTEQQHEFFFGRNEEAEELFRCVKRDRITLLFGKSGLGKTSLLQAGLFPRLRAAAFLPVYIRLRYDEEAPAAGEQIKTALENAIVDANLAEVAMPEPGELAWEYLHRRSGSLVNDEGNVVTPVLVFDQFEEWFTLGVRRAEALRGELLETLTDLIENRTPQALGAKFVRDRELSRRYDVDSPGCRILITLREDYLPNLENIRDQMPSLVFVDNRMRLTEMNGGQALAVVAEPNPKLLERDVPELIVRFVAGAQASGSNGHGGGHDQRPLRNLEIAPAILSLFCTELNDKRLKQNLPTISKALVTAQGVTIIDDFYHRATGEMPPAVRRLIEERLLTKAGYRDNVDFAEARSDLEQAGVSSALLDDLIKLRVLQVEEHRGIPRLELTHDVLADPVKRSRDRRLEQEAWERQERAKELALAEARKAEEAALEKARFFRKAIIAGTVALIVLATALGLALVSRQTAKAEEKKAKAALAEKDTALADKETALREKNNALNKAQAEEQKAKAEEGKAKAAEKKAKRSAAELRDSLAEQKRLAADQYAQVLEHRAEVLENAGNIRSLADTLSSNASPLESTSYLWAKEEAFTGLGDHEGIVQADSVALENVPNYFTARASRGYEYILLGRPKEAEKDLRAVLQVDPRHTDSQLNLAIALGMQHRYDEAVDCINKAIQNSTIRQGSGKNFESEVWPDIRHATGRDILQMSDSQLNLALYYEVATLRAAQGSPGFKTALRAADTQLKNRMSDKTESLDIMNVQFVALNWAWLHHRFYPQDLGIYAAYGALWERIASQRPIYFSWSLHYYLLFQQAYGRLSDPKAREQFAALDHFVSMHITELRRRGVSMKPVEVHEDDARTLALAAERLALTQSDNPLSLAEVNRLYTEALDKLMAQEKDPSHPRAVSSIVELLMERSDIRQRAKDLDGARRDCETILKLVPNSSFAYLTLARISETATDKQKYYEKVLELDPVNSSALTGMKNLTADTEPEMALSYLDRSLQIYPGSAWRYRDKYELLAKLNRKDEAVKAINQAILLDPDRFDYYVDRAEAATNAGKEEKSQIVLDEMAGFITVSDNLARKGNTPAALDGYVRTMMIANQAGASARTEEIKSQVALVAHKISTLLESHGGTPQSVSQFWQKMRAAQFAANYDSVIDQELNHFRAKP